MSHELLTDVVDARVVVGSVCTPYQAAGRGAPVIVLSDVPERVSPLLSSLPRHLRVIAPKLHEVECQHSVAIHDFSVWLATFLDALGVERVTLVTDSAFEVGARAFAAQYPSRVRKVALLSPSPNADTIVELTAVLDAGGAGED